jgi:hypothetical protein
VLPEGKEQVCIHGGWDPRKVRIIWREALKEGNATILKENLTEKVRSTISQLNRLEWDLLIKDLQQHRKKDKSFDCKMAMLVYYNEEISSAEMERRWSMLDQGVVQRTLADCVALSKSPRQESWHRKENIAFT